MRQLYALGFAAMLAVTVACGGSDSPSSPMAPSAVSNPSGPSAGPTSGALLTGTVTVASTARTVTTRDTGGLTVSISGTNLSATVDGSGNFTLDGVPSGNVQLKISGSGVDVTLTVGNVQAGQTIKLKITVSGTTGTIDSDSRDGDDADDDDDGEKQELEGRIESILGTSLIVSGQTVMTDGNTTIRKGDTPVLFSELVVGLRVHVKGTPVAGSNGGAMSLLATEIKVQNENTTVPMKVEGVVAAAPVIDHTSCPSITFVLEGKNITVKTDGRTNFRSSCFEVVAGATVEVMGRLQSVTTDDTPTAPNGSTILADKLEVTKAPDDDDDEGGSGSGELEFKGALAGLTGSCPAISFKVGTGTDEISTSSSTSFKPSCNALKNGDQVEVKAISSAGKILATKVEKK